MGNVIYSILTELWPFEANNDVKEVQKKITMGIRPPLANFHNDDISSFLVEIIHLCWRQDSNERPTARRIVSLLDDKIKMLERMTFKTIASN